MDITVLLFLIPMSCFLGYMIVKAKRDKIPVDAICTKVERGVYVRMRVYHGTYKFCIRGKEYEVYDEEGSNIKPPLNKPIKIYIEREDFSKMVPLVQIRLYQWLIGLMLFFAVVIAIKEVYFWMM